MGNLYTIRSGVTNHPEASVLQHLTDVTKCGGVINPSVDFVCTEYSGGGLVVQVSSGHAILKGATAYPVRSTTSETVAISPNASGSPRIDTVILYIDTSINPDSDDEAKDVAFLVSIDGTPAGSPVAKSDADIQTEIGANNPFIRRSDVYVASGATGISDEDITNSNQRAFIHSMSTRHPITFSSTITPNFNQSNKQYVTLTADMTIASPTNMEVGDAIEIDTIQDGTGGRDITFFTTITWMSPDTTQNTDPGKHTVYVFEKTGAATWNGYLAGKEY